MTDQDDENRMHLDEADQPANAAAHAISSPGVAPNKSFDSRDLDDVGGFLESASSSGAAVLSSGGTDETRNEGADHDDPEQTIPRKGRLEEEDDDNNDIPPMPHLPGRQQKNDDQGLPTSQPSTPIHRASPLSSAAASTPSGSNESSARRPRHHDDAMAAATPVIANRKLVRPAPATPMSGGRADTNVNSSTNTPGSASASGDFWTDFTAATAEETKRAVRNIFYTTRDRAEGNSGTNNIGGGGGGGGGGNNAANGGSDRKLRRPGSASKLARADGEGGRVGSTRRLKRPDYAAAAPAATSTSTQGASDDSEQQEQSSSRRSSHESSSAMSAPASPTTSQTASSSTSKLSPKQSPGVRRTGRPGKSKRYASVSVSHDEEEEEEGEGEASAVPDHEFTIGDLGDDDDGEDVDDAGIRGARSASLDSVGDILKNATGPMSPDTAGSQESPPPPPRQPSRRAPSNGNGDIHPPILGNLSYPDPDEERRIVESFWRLYDDHIILSIFGILGILFRILASSWFRMFDDAFNENSALFTNLPLNCLSCFIMGLLCSGEDAIKILYTRAPGLNGIGVGAAKKDDAKTPHTQQQATTPTNGQLVDNPHEGEFVFRESGVDTDDYVARGGRPAGASPSAPIPSVTSPVNEIRQRRSRPIDRIRAGGREMVLEVITGGTPAAEDTDPDEEVREVQLMALERRIRASKSLVLFPAKKEDVDVMDTYFDNGEDDDWSYSNGGSVGQSASFESRTGAGDDVEHHSTVPAQPSLSRVAIISSHSSSSMAHCSTGRTSQPDGSGPRLTETSSDQATGSEDAVDGHEDDGLGLDRMVNEVTENITRLTQVDIAEGWDVGTTPEAMSDDLLLGLRVGFCGCLSTFSSWNSAMINLLWNGHITQALVGYAIGIQLPIISYRAGQHAAVYWFVWRRRREVKRAERRGGYGLRLRGGEIDSDDESEGNSMNGDTFHDEPEDIEANFDGTPTDDGGSLDRQSRHSLDSGHGPKRKRNPNGGRILVDDNAADRTTPSVRAIATAVFLLMITLLINSLFFLDDTQTSISLLFSPFGVLARWRLMRLNKLRPGFPLGTFACNMLGCALSGSLGSLLAGNPGPEESMVVQSMIQGFAGALSSLAAFVVELLTLIDPIIFKYDGLRYAVLTICWALVVGFITSQAKDWADKI